VSKQPIGKNPAAEAKKEPPKATSPTAKAMQEKGLVVADVGGRTDKKVSATKTAPGQTADKADKQEKKNDAAGTFLVQVVSYKEKGKSELAAKKVKFLGFKAKIVPVDLAAKGKWYRVVVDGFETKEKAQKAAHKIRGQIKGTQCIVRTNSPMQKASR
jgi:cell division protein FtsN